MSLSESGHSDRCARSHVLACWSLSQNLLAKATLIGALEARC